MGQRRQNCLVYIWLKGSGHLNCLAYFLGSILLVQKKGEHVACTRTLNGRYHAAIADDVQSAMFTRLVRLGAREGRVIPRLTTAWCCFVSLSIYGCDGQSEGEGGTRLAPKSGR